MRNRVFDVVFTLMLAIAIGFVFGTLAACHAQPLPDLAKVPRAQYARTITDTDGVKCQAWLPLVVRAEVGQDYLARALQAAQPWADALGFTLVVPALEGEDAPVTIVVEACPVKYATRVSPYCSRLAETWQRCDGAVYRQEVRLFVPGDATEEFFLLMHELGHALGADGDAPDGFHSTDTASIMYPTLTPVPSKADPGIADDDPTPSGPLQWVRPADVTAVRRTWSIK